MSTPVRSEQMEGAMEETATCNNRGATFHQKSMHQCIFHASNRSSLMCVHAPLQCVLIYLQYLFPYMIILLWHDERKNRIFYTRPIRHIIAFSLSAPHMLLYVNNTHRAVSHRYPPMNRSNCEILFISLSLFFYHASFHRFYMRIRDNL